MNHSIFLILVQLSFCLNLFGQEYQKVITVQSPFYKSIDHVLMSADGKTIIAVDKDGHLFSWDAFSGSLSRIMRTFKSNIDKIAISPDNKLIATFSNYQIFLWDNEKGVQLNTLNVSGNSTGLLFHPSNKTLYYALYNDVFKVAISNFSNPVKIYSTSNTITSLNITEDEKIILISESGNLTLMNLDEQKIKNELSVCPQIKQVGISQNFIICLCSDSNIYSFTLKENILKNTEVIQMPDATYVSLLPDKNRVLLIVLDETRKLIWKTKNEKLINAKGLPENITALNFGADKNHLITGSNDGSVSVFKIPGIADEKDTPLNETTSRTSTAEKLELTAAGLPKTLNNRTVKLHPPVEVKSTQIELLIWDDEHVDSDTISLNFNGKWILENYMVTHEKKKLTVTLERGKPNFLIMHAHNLGTFPPNTAAVSFNDGNKDQVLTLKSDLKRSDALHFIIKD